MRVSTSKAIKLLLQEESVALPTETVYGLAALARSPVAIAKVYEAKKRPSDNPLIIHIASYQQLQKLIVDIPPGGQELMKRFWPGALTLVLPASPEVPQSVTGGLPSVAIRMPAHPLMHEILQETGPLVAPSANLSGKPSPTTATHVETDLGAQFPVVDGGACTKGLESTILLFKEGEWAIGREGSLSAEELGIGKLIQGASVPGSRYRHYAPAAKLSALKNGRGVVLGFSDRSYPEATTVLSFGKSTDPEEVATTLYALLRQLDREGVEEAEVDLDFPAEGLLSTVRERLLRAIQA